MKFIINDEIREYRTLAPEERGMAGKTGDICCPSHWYDGETITELKVYLDHIDWEDGEAMKWSLEGWSNTTKCQYIETCCEESAKEACTYYRLASDKPAGLKMNKIFSEPLPLP